MNKDRIFLRTSNCTLNGKMVNTYASYLVARSITNYTGMNVLNFLACFDMKFQYFKEFSLVSNFDKVVFFIP